MVQQVEKMLVEAKNFQYQHQVPFVGVTSPKNTSL